MIIRDSPSHLGLFLVTQGSIVPRIAPLIGLVFVFAFTIWLVDGTLFTLPHIPLQATSIFGIALSLFLGFRNNAAYERWWEARRLWGQLVADFRSFARESDLFVENAQTREALIHEALCFIHLHKRDLRGDDISADLARWGGPGTQFERAKACDALNRAARHIRDAARRGEIDGFGCKALSERLAAIALAQAGSERIRNTPLPFVYSLLVLRTTWLYCFAVPFALIETTGVLTPLFAAVIAYVFFGLAAVTDELEHPFGTAVHALPLNAMCRTIEIALAPRLGMTPPDPLVPEDHVLT
ncbi:bestrophin family protein [Roseivivax sp. THAF30]|uniref:bestrophin family protein n=1 Tax=Roseivivax sp. THAF30 TaxID=2587852 RepID=UPI0012684E90|nr:bestrophin family ion channel [Roseivivax sp. THAF30]QFT61308.1 Bestrophin, RFP-TM, chloride channel [Roseivivax sp. THAF30]